MTLRSRIHARVDLNAGFAAAVLICTLAANVPARSQSNSNGHNVTAVSGIVTGKVQKVGFRALIQKQAIQYDLAGRTENNDKDKSVQFLLQGDKDRIDLALKKIRKGPKRGRVDNVELSPVPVDARLTTFTAVKWTSQSRHICNPYNLVFDLRADNSMISKDDAKDVWLDICKKTVRGEDVGKCDKDNLAPGDRRPCPDAD